MPLIQRQFTVGYTTYQQRLIKCGNKRCKACPHGPYWYAIVNVGKGHKVTKYIGKTLPKKLDEICQAKFPEDYAYEETINDESYGG